MKANFLFFVMWVDPYVYWRIFTKYAEYFRVIYLGFILVGSGFILCLMNLISVILKIYVKEQLEIFSIIFGVCLILLITIVNILKIVYLEKWEPNKIQANNINGSISVVLFVVFAIGSAVLLRMFKKFSTLKSEKNKNQKKKYLRLGLSFCTLGGSALFSVTLWFLAESSVSKLNIYISFTVLSFSVLGTLLASLSAVLMFVPTKKKEKSFNTNSQFRSNTSFNSMKDSQVFKKQVLN